MFRLVIFAAISVLFGDRVDVQAGLGLCTLFGSLYIHLLVQPYVNDLLNKAEEIGLVTSWLTLYGGTLLFSDNITNGYKMTITAFIIFVNIAFIFYVVKLMYTESRMYIDRVISRAESMSKLLISRFQSARTSRANSLGSEGSGDSDEGGLKALQSLEMRALSIRVAGTPVSGGSGDNTPVAYQQNAMFKLKRRGTDGTKKKSKGKGKEMGKEREKDKDKGTSKTMKKRTGRRIGKDDEGHVRSTTETLEQVSGQLMRLSVERAGPSVPINDDDDDVELGRASARRASIFDTLASAASTAFSTALAPSRLSAASANANDPAGTGVGIVLEDEEYGDEDLDDGPDWVVVETDDGRRYFWNHKTDEVAWEVTEDMDVLR